MSIPEKMLVRVLLAGVKGDWKLLQSWGDSVGRLAQEST